MQIDLEKLKNEIKYLCRSLYRAKSFSQYREIVYALDNLLEIYQLLTGEELDTQIFINPYYESMFDRKKDYRYSLVQNYLINLNQHLNLSKKVIDTYNDTGFIYYDREKSQSKLRKTDMIDLIRTFLNSYDSSLDKLFINMIDGSINACGGTSITDVTFKIPKLSKSYILVDYNLTIEGAATIIHELGHAYFNKLFDNISFNQITKVYDYYFFEVFSMYLEKVFIEYLINHNIYVKDAYLSENFSLYALLDNFMVIDELKDVFDNEYVEEEDIDEIYNSLIYSYGDIISLELFDKYEQDSELTRHNVKKFITSQGILHGDELLNLIGISQSDLESCKVLRKNLKKHNKNMEKITRIY